MVPQPGHKGGSPQPFDGTETVLPGNLAPYYLQANRGPAYLIEGIVTRPLATMKESGARFEIGSIEGSAYHSNETIGTKMRFGNVNHALYVVDGEFEISIDDTCTTVRAYETIYIPKAMSFSIKIVSRFAKAYVFANGAGLVETLMAVGQSYTQAIVPEKEARSVASKLSTVASQMGLELV